MKNNNATPKQTELDMGIQCYIDGKPVRPEEFTKSYGCLDDASPSEWDAVNKQSIKYDVVNKPKHYNSGDIECIDAMQSMLSEEEFRGYLRGNSFKYRWRYPDKNGLEDISKAQWYENKLLEVLRSNGK